MIICIYFSFYNDTLSTNFIMKKADIKNRGDLEKVVKLFYTNAMSDPIIGFFFTQVVPIDLDEHTPKITDFWEAMLFGRDPLNQGHYAGNMLQAHIAVDAKARMQTGHFTRWLYLFSKSVDESFQGENAERLKNRAKKMATSMSDALRSKRGEDRIGVESLNKR